MKKQGGVSLSTVKLVENFQQFHRSMSDQKVVQTERPLQGSVTNFDLSEKLRLLQLQQQMIPIWGSLPVYWKTFRVHNDLKKLEKQSGEEYAFQIKQRTLDLVLIDDLHTTRQRKNEFYAKGLGNTAVKLDVIL